MRENMSIIAQVNGAMTKEEAISIKQWNGEVAMSTLRIAEVTGKKHKDVLRDVRKIFAELDLEESKFALLYLSDNNQKTKHYMLPEREFNIVVSGYSLKYRAQLIDELMEYRKGMKKLTPLEQAHETMKMLEREIQAEKEENRMLEQFIDNTMNGEKMLTFEMTSKLLYDRYGFNIGRNTLIRLLRDAGIIMPGTPPRPYQRYSGWFKMVKKVSPNGNTYDVTLVYEDKLKYIYKYAMQEFETKQ